jgi:hypothetical protein
MNRRTFLQSAVLTAGIPTAFAKAGFLEGSMLFQDEDELLCKKKFEIAISKEWKTKPINEVIVEVGRTFLGTEYVANALEVPGEERLVVNMRGLDCVSFYENALVIARCIKKNKMTFEDYKKELLFVRYRGGIIDGYPSRLHYTSDYIDDNDRKGVWKNVTKDLGGIPFVKTLNFMSTHPDNYRQIRESEKVKAMIAAMEQEISKRPMYYIPKDRVAAISEKLREGNIIGTTTDVEGIDTSHTGILVRQNGKLHFMHAPLAGKKVQISDREFHDYLAANKRQTGIMVARPLEPA